MAKTDFTYCMGVHCPNKTHCVRYVNGLEAVGNSDRLHSWIQSCRHSKLFIHTDSQEEAV